MTASEVTLALFTLCNGLRIIAYVPQIVRAARDTSGAEAISVSTWGLFLLANISAVAYALVNKDDWTMAIVFLANGVGCTVILAIAGWNRRRHRNARRLRPSPAPTYYIGAHAAAFRREFHVVDANRGLAPKSGRSA